MEFNFKKDWMKWLIIALAITTAVGFDFIDGIIQHTWQMYALSGLVIYHFFVEH